MPRTKHVLPFVVALLGAACSSSSDPQPVVTSPNVAPRTAACALKVQAPRDVVRECFTVAVPVTRRGDAQPAETLDLYVERFTRGDGPTVVYLTGGPGVGLDAYASLGVLDKALASVRGELLLVEQRGNARSPGKLACNAGEPVTACLSRLGASGARPDAYNSVESAADVVGVLDAFGRDKAVLWGHSYGSGLAQYVAQNHPSRISKLILEGVSEPTTPRPEDPIPSRLAILDAFGKWFTARCAAQPSCATAYPQGIDADAEVTMMISTLDADPKARVDLGADQRLEQGDLVTWFLNGLATHDGMLAFVQLAHAFNRVTASDRAALDAWTARVGNGDSATGARAVRGFASALSGISAPASGAVKSCFDLQSFGMDEDCAGLSRSAYPAETFKLAFRTDLPTLLFNGALDTQVLPRETELVRPRFTAAREVKLPTCIGHFVFRDSGACGDAVIAGFLSGDDATPAACASTCDALPLVPRLFP